MRKTIPILSVLAGISVVAVLALPMASLAKEKLGSIEIAISVNYGSAYRDGTWAPVDVLVKNDDFNISGWVEVRMLANGTLQSPVYRLAADLPKGSRKRFRFHCYLKGTTRIEAMIYNGKSAVMEMPTYIAVQPVNPHDVLCLVLDEEPTDFSFLYTALQAETPAAAQPRPGDAPQADSGDARRLHRESLKNETLSYLADHPQCYEPFDLIIAGNIEPDRIGERHRTLLKQYVERGGVLVVCTGSNAAKYRNSWIEQWSGTSVGAQEAVSERDLAEAVFPGFVPEEARRDRQCVFCQLTPVVPDVKVRGDKKVLATMRQIGQGCVVVVAIDASSRALQNCREYLAMWDQLYSFRRNRGAVNLDNAGQFCVQQMPYLSGVRVNPSDSVAGYLFLYLLVGIVANWLFFNRLKRRELAWVALIFISFGFTAYAMIFGASGRVKKSEVEQVRVLHLGRAGEVASQTEFLGALSVRSASRSMKLANEFALARDSGVTRMPWAMRYGSQAGDAPKPFAFVQGKGAPSIESLTLRASEIRVLQVQSDVTLAGGIEGSVYEKDGRWNVSVKNKTGMRLDDPAILLDGRLYRLPAGSTEWNGPLNELIGFGNGEDQRYNRYGGMRPPYGMNSPYGSPQDLAEFKKAFPLRLFSEDPYRLEVSPALGPMLCGWVASGPASAVAFEGGMSKGIEENFLVADIGVERTGRQVTAWRFLQADLTHGDAPPGMGGMPGEAPGMLTLSNQSGVATVWIAAPEWLLKSDAEEILVDVFWNSAEADVSFSIFPSPTARSLPGKWVDLSADASAEDAGSTRPPTGNFSRKATFRLSDWRRNYLTNQTLIKARAVCRPVLGLAGPAGSQTGVPAKSVNVQVQARVKWTLGQDPNQGGLTGWR